ncbi:glycosyltransferase family 2 protein [Metabacillus malikii]|uniref:Glycosyltransferase involved in cell wall biosynthesis n=1 Tax=Metabacillus malikii TaxID=1504265 RepID=A0ABT9ZJT1_9BACI|nr:glycosyltransferase [Metabacillus malikii]MDQ0232508.1 glycosyltransferase involved in cell wall biosynthesis [Metabacillus malikii]
MTILNPLISVVIPFYNCRYVNQAIVSVLKQSYPHIEIIVVNDGSTTNQHLITPYMSKITYIEQENKGVAAALNAGIEKANGLFIAWLSSDDLFEPNKIKKQLKFMKSKNAMISFTDFNLIDKNSSIIKKNLSKNYVNEQEILETFLESCPINGCTVMMHRNVIESIGTFNEQLKFTQDYEYWLRVALEHPIYYLPVALTNYRTHEQMGSIVYREEQMTEFQHIKDEYSPKIKQLLTNGR